MSRKMIDYKVEEGKITSIDGYSVGGDEITGAKLKENIAKSTPNDGMDYSLTTDGTGRLIIKAKGRYEYKNDSFSTEFNAPAGTYVLGQSITLNKRVQINWGYFISIDSTYQSIIPYPSSPRVDTEPIWRIEALPNSNGTMYVRAICIKEGTLNTPKNYGEIRLNYTYLYYGNY